MLFEVYLYLNKIHNFLIYRIIRHIFLEQSEFGVYREFLFYFLGAVLTRIEN